MSLESFMLKDEVKEVEYVASNRFVDKEGKNVGNITGTSDLVLADKQLKLML